MPFLVNHSKIERYFIGTIPKPIKHKDQQDVKFALLSKFPDTVLFFMGGNATSVVYRCYLLFFTHNGPSFFL